MSRKMFVCLLLLTFPVIASAQTRVDLDRHKDFSRYKTFTLDITPPVGADGVTDENNTLALDRLRQAVTREIEARGLEPSEGRADLTVRVSSSEADRTEIMRSAWDPYPWAWGSRRRYWRGWGYWGPSYADVWTRRYVEGSLKVDVIERDTGALVYRAQVTDEVGDNLDKYVTKAVDKAFKKFPIKELSAN